MAATTRQTNLLIQQDWKKIYQSFQNADFQSYDFETLRKSMIDYLRTYYPEDFNDFLESSEYVALIDLIAFLGQSLAFRTDLNARENFLDTAERRDSVLKLARLISYNPKRNVCSSGLLKIETVYSTEDLFDSSGLNLSNIPITWNDSGNDNWLEQFSIILNAAFVNSQVVGRPGNTQNISGVRTEEYSVNLLPNIIPAFKYTSLVETSNMNFEVVSATSQKEIYLYEADPIPSRIFNLLYRNDNLGNDSINTGWFLYFKQGDINQLDFTLTDSLPNRTVSVNVDNINNTDVWLYKLDNAGRPVEKWTLVPNVAGFNVIYNNSKERNIFQINTRANDQLDLVFGDGAFANIPIGSFRLYYRVSNGLGYKITPDEMQSVIIPLTYVSKNGRAETLSIRASLQYTVSNASSRESIDDIKAKAPQQYYTQNRMVTGEDYNILPYTLFNNIVKIKAINRSSSGVSRYLDTIDVTGKYSATNVFGEDGALYRQETIDVQDYVVPTNGDIVGSLIQSLNNKLLVDNYVPFTQFIYEKLPRYNTIDAEINGTIFDTQWVRLTTGTNQCTGYFTTARNFASAETSGSFATPLKVGTASSNALKYITKGSIIKFKAVASFNPEKAHFDSTNDIRAGSLSRPGDRDFIYATVVKIDGDGTNGGIITANNAGPVTLSTFIPDGAYIEEIIPQIYNIIPSEILRSAGTLINTKKNFGLRFDQRKQTWAVIQPQDLKITQGVSQLATNSGVNAEYSELAAGNTSAASLDSSWLISFVSTNLGYKIFYRQINYVFESKRETKFYFDPKVRVYDPKSAKVIDDQIKILRSNPAPDSGVLYDDKIFFVHKMILDPDGYENTNKILVKYPDTNRDGIPDNPDLFTEVVAPSVNTVNKNIFFTKVYAESTYVSYDIINDGIVETGFISQSDIVDLIDQYDNGQIFYTYGENLFYDLVIERFGTDLRKTLVPSADGEKYLLLKGRQDLFFQYRHTAPSTRRIDPSPSNLIDLFVLTKQFAAEFQSYAQDSTGRIALPDQPTTEQLQLEYGSLEEYKAISDTLIYASARFKLLFGAKAESALRATFKVVKNPSIVVTDNEVKTAVISAINQYFDVANWDFGEPFFFSELSAYLHQVLTPKISSVVIVPTSTFLSFGNLYQINAEPDEIMLSCATVDNVEIISAITAANLL